VGRLQPFDLIFFYPILGCFLSECKAKYMIISFSILSLFYNIMKVTLHIGDSEHKIICK